MYPKKGFIKRFEALLAELDDAADDVDEDAVEALEDLNAEFEDAIFMFSELDPKDDDFQESLDDTLETLSALAGDYERWPECKEIASALKALAVIDPNEGAVSKQKYMQEGNPSNS